MPNLDLFIHSILWKWVIIFDYIVHSVIGLLVGYGLQLFLGLFGIRFDILYIMVYYIGIVFGSLLVDIDNIKSKIGRKFKILSSFIYDIFGHRGIFHKIWFWTIVFGLIWLGIGNDIIWFTGVAVGIVMHIVGDKISDSINRGLI